MEKNINLNIIKEKNYFWLNNIFSTDIDNYNNFVKTQIEKLKQNYKKTKFDIFILILKIYIMNY